MVWIPPMKMVMSGMASGFYMTFKALEMPRENVWRNFGGLREHMRCQTSNVRGCVKLPQQRVLPNLRLCTTTHAFGPGAYWQFGQFAAVHHPDATLPQPSKKIWEGFYHARKMGVCYPVCKSNLQSCLSSGSSSCWNWMRELHGPRRIFMGGEAAGVDQHDEHLDSWEITSPEGQISWISEIFIWLHHLQL